MIYDTHAILNFLESYYKAIFILMAVFSALALYFGKVICDIMPQISEKQDWYFVGTLFILVFIYWPLIILIFCKGSVESYIVRYIELGIVLAIIDLCFRIIINIIIIIINIIINVFSKSEKSIKIIFLIFILGFNILLYHHFFHNPNLKSFLLYFPILFLGYTYLAMMFGEIMRDKVTVKVYLKDGEDCVLEGELIKHLKDAIHIRIKKKDKDGKEVYENHFILKENIKEIVWCDESKLNESVKNKENQPK